jgi:hypothetical protein
MQLCKYCNVQRPDESFEVCRVVNGKVYRRLRCRKCKQRQANERRFRLRAWLTEYKKTLWCQRCGIHDHRVLQFHHEGGEDKIANIADMTRWSQQSILREIAKCVVLCANCHCIVHYEEEELLAEEFNSAEGGSTRTGRRSRARSRRRG